MITVATLLWSPNRHSKSFSTAYTEAWVERLFRGFARNLTKPFRFVCYVDRPRTFAEPIYQVRLRSPEPTYADCIQPYELGCPMILVGLDTVVTGNIDHLADYCMTADKIALPRDPYAPHRACNGVALVPAGMEAIAKDHRGENDMEWLRAKPHAFLDDLWPGQVVSWKGRVEKFGAGDARLIYFHGERKPHQMPNNALIQEHWR